MKIDRINQIHELLIDMRSISIKELCERFNVSKNTIRRDIAELEQKGIVRKVYGGIVLNEEKDGDAAPEPFASREIRNVQSKKIIARLAAEQVKENDVIYIDSGTTTMHMIPHLAQKRRVTILTASLHVVNAAANYPNLNVISTGGSLYTPSKSFVGPSVISCLQKYNISKVFMAATGISLEHGATNASQLECEIKQYLAQLPATKYLLVDHSKIDKSSLMTYSNLSGMDYIIMDRQPPQKYLDFFKANHITLLTPQPAFAERS